MEAAECRSEAEDKEVVYKTKVIQFLGRSTPIILQNENGPCPLLAICNALLLRNNINLSVDEPEVPQQKLLSLVADRLIGSNSNVQDKDFGYLINQQQNIADAIDLLPRLATGIDVNVQFRKINDFEFTRECTIFDLLDIGLYHGWIVDPQDSETASAVGTKSYNTLAGELVAFEAKKFEMESKKISDADSVDFVAATTAVLGVPSPSLSRGRSLDSCPDTVSSDQIVGKGDREEAEELLRVLNLSRDEVSCPASDSVSADALSQQEATPILTSTSEVSSSSFMHQDEVDSKTIDLLDKAAEQECRSSKYLKDNALPTEAVSIINDSLLPIVDVGSNAFQSTDNSDKSSSYVEGAYLSGETVHSTPFDAISQPKTDVDDIAGRHASVNVVDLDRQVLNFERKELLNVPEIASGLDISEPLYEGEDRILDSRLSVYEDREPIYEGEMALVERTVDGNEVASTIHSDDQVSERQCYLIKNFLESTASQLTIYGLFCLQEGLKERELSVFFRNNHFSTMFKFNGELFLLVTDQGYINQPDLVWEKLNEVNGDTVFMTSNFTEFKADNQVNDSWNEHNAIKNTADYLATLEGSVPSNSSLNSDLQLAIALQQQEFEQPQPQQQQQQQQQQLQLQQQQQQQNTQQTSIIGRSRLVTGPQVSRNTNVPQKGESKLKEKCRIM